MRVPRRRAVLRTTSRFSGWRARRTLPLTACLLVAVLLAAGSVPLRSQAQTGVALNLTQNWSFETFDGTYVDDRVARYWVAFEVSGTDVQFRQGTQFAGSTVERIDGYDSQIIMGDEPFDAGVYQIVTGLRAGQWYSAIAYVLSIFQTSAVDDPSVFDGAIVKQIGVDPSGGRNPLSADIIWGDAVDKNMDRASWGERLTFEAQGTTATFFIRVQALQGVSHSSYDNIAFIDGAQIRLAPISQATVPDTAAAGAFDVSWQSVVPNAYSYEATVIEYDVQYRDGEGPWQDWLLHTTSRTQTFGLVTPGHEYSFRVRGWARYYGTASQGSFAELYGPWAESAAVRLGQVVEATALDNRGFAVYQVPMDLLLGSTVVSSGLTDGAGHAYLAGDGINSTYSVAARETYFGAPPPVHGVEIGAGISPVCITLLPPDEAVPDGSFESSTAGEAPGGWSVSSSKAQVTDFRAHTGLLGVELATDSTTTGVCMARTFQVDDSYLPVLSFWYRMDPAQGGTTKVLRAQVRDNQGYVLAETSLSSAAATEWRTDHLELTSDETPFSGTVTVEFCLMDPSATTEATVRAYVDDVSLGSTAGGPVKAYLPVALTSSD